MSLDRTLEFCNQYLMLKILTNNYADIPNPNKTQQIKQLTSKKKTGRTPKFQNHAKKPINPIITQEIIMNEQPQKIKPKKKKFQGGSHKRAPSNHLNDLKINQNQEQKQQGYIPIQNLLSQLSLAPQNKKNTQNNFKSFGGTEMNMNNNKYSNNYNYQVKTSNYSTSNNSYYPQRQPANNYQKQWAYKNQMNDLYSTFTLNPSKSQYLYESPRRIKEGYSVLNVPVSRSRSKSPLDHSQSCSNLSTYSQNRSYNNNQPVASTKKKKGQRQFYIPVCSIPRAQQQPNLDLSRVTSTNHIIAKMQRQLIEQNNSMLKNQQFNTQKSKYQTTRYDTKSKSSIMKEMDQYSMIQLDNGIKQQLSFVSQTLGPPKPIRIQLKK